MAVRFGPGTWPGLTSIKLYDEELVPVCSPAFRGVDCRVHPVAFSNYRFFMTSGSRALFGSKRSD